MLPFQNYAQSFQSYHQIDHTHAIICLSPHFLRTWWAILNHTSTSFLFIFSSISLLSQFLSRFYSLSFPRSSCRDGALPEGAVVTHMATS